jgi:hypothetical protein
VEERKARALYSLFEEAMKETRKLDGNHPVGFVNGDAGFLDIIAEECPSLDILGVNMYRGLEAGSSFYETIKTKLDKPLVFTEIGADAWNALENREDQYSQAAYIASQWQEIYSQTYGKGTGNALGGCVFEWTDEWWKHLPDDQINLDIHDTAGDWSEVNYHWDYAPGKPNMNEEWLGITAQGRWQGKFTMKERRAAFFVLQHIWSLSPVDADLAAVEDHFLEVWRGMGLAAARGMEASREERPSFGVKNQISFLAMQSGNDIDKDFDVLSPFTAFDSRNWGMELRSTLSGTAIPGFWGELSGEVTLLLRHDAFLGNPSASLVEKTIAEIDPGRAFDVYSARFSYTARDMAFNGYYHSGHGDWVNEGDFFQFLPESYNLELYDKRKSKAPVALEFIKHFRLEGKQGLAVLAGPEIYPDARPQIMGKWFQTIGDFSFSAMLSQETGISDISERGSNQEPSGKASLWASWDVISGGGLLLAQAGALVSQWNKTGWDYRIPGEKSSIIFGDALAVKGRITWQPVSYISFRAEYIHAGLVADTNPADQRDSVLWTDIGTGNRDEVKGGMTGIYGPFTLQLNALWRQPIIDALTDPSVPGGLRHSMYPAVSLRPAEDADPFTVYRNRKALQFETIFAFDPQGATWMWAWDNDDQENSVFASSISGVYSVYQGATDPFTYVGEDDLIHNLDTGLPEVRGTGSLLWRVIFNPLPDLRIVNRAEFVRGQSTGGAAAGDSTDRLINGFQNILKVRYKRVVVSGLAAFDLWGPEEYNRTWNQTYPLRWGLEVSYSLQPLPSLLDRSNRVGAGWKGLIRDRYSENYTVSRETEELYLFFNISF